MWRRHRRIPEKKTEENREERDRKTSRDREGRRQGEKLRRRTPTENKGEELKQTKALRDQPRLLRHRFRPFISASRFVLLVSGHAFPFSFMFKWIIIHLNRNGACTVRKLTRASYLPSPGHCPATWDQLKKTFIVFLCIYFMVCIFIL